jgi:hypothetical protein
MKRDDAKGLDDIIESNLPDIEKLAQSFGWIASRNIERTGHEIELARAMGDQELVVREQIKMEMMKHARSIFQDCYQRVTRKRAWDE